jgi:hypothetical protein
MADINDRLDRLQRREEFDRNGLPLRPEPGVVRPAGVDDRLGEVLDAVAAVVRRHPGLSVMIAVADGRAGRPVVRVTERDGTVETGVVVVSGAGGSAPPPTAAAQTAAVPTTERPRDVDPHPTEPGRHAVRPERTPTGSGWSGSSWHDSLWSAGAQARFRGPDAARPEHRRPDQDADTDRLRLVADEEAAAPPPPPGGTVPLPEDTSQVVSRLAQLLRDNPTLASNWSREAPE